LKIVPSGSGFAQLTRLSELQKQILSEQLRALEDDFDVMFVDTGAGINEQVTDFNCAAQDIVIVTTPEPHAMTDAYALIKVLHQDYKLNKFNLLVNMVRSDEQGTKVSSRISEVSDKYLGIRVNYLGCVPMDNQVQMLILNRMAGSDQLIHTLAGQAWNRVALNFFNAKDSPKEKDQEDFWQKLLWTTQDNRAIRNTII
jgi:flagellar biosynthesis protein FlhG